MKTEFFKDNKGCFKPEIMIWKMGAISPKTFDEIDENSKKQWFLLFLDNRETKKLIDYQHSLGNRDRDEILKYIIAKKFSGISRQFDIDETTLNFD